MNFAITKSQLSKALGVARTTLHRWEKLPGWPTAGKKGWSVAACSKFIESQGLTAPSDLGEERRLLVRAQRLLAEQRLKKEIGELVKIDDIKETHGVAMAQFTAILKRTLSRQDYDACTRQFQEIKWEAYEQKR